MTTRAVIGLWTAMLLVAGCGPPTSQSQDPDAAPNDGAPPDAAVYTDGAPPQDGAPTDASTDPDAGAWTYSCTPVGSSLSDGFFTLVAFAGQLYAGQFGYGYEAQSMLFRHPPWEHVQPGLLTIGESVCDLHEHGGYLYANTENSGDIFRSVDGANWTLVYNGDPGVIGCGLAEFGGELYAVNYNYATSDHGRILREDGGSWTAVFDSGASPLYLREIVSYQNTLYAFGVENGQGYMVHSTDGTNWTQQAVAQRFFRGHVWGGYLWLGSASLSANGHTAVWRFDGTNFTEVHPRPDQTHISALTDYENQLFVATSHGWKTETGPSFLLRSPDGVNDWQTVCTFSETAAWSMAVVGQSLYVGTWEYTVGGHVYEVVKQPLTAVDCSQITATNPAWEVCQQGDHFCAGVFSDGAGCQAFCAAAGLPVTACYGGEPGCVQEPATPLDCSQPSGHQSDWCECGTP